MKESKLEAIKEFVETDINLRVYIAKRAIALANMENTKSGFTNNHAEKSHEWALNAVIAEDSEIYRILNKERLIADEELRIEKVKSEPMQSESWSEVFDMWLDKLAKKNETAILIPKEDYIPATKEEK